MLWQFLLLVLNNGMQHIYCPLSWLYLMIFSVLWEACRHNKVTRQQVLLGSSVSTGTPSTSPWNRSASPSSSRTRGLQSGWGRTRPFSTSTTSRSICTRWRETWITWFSAAVRYLLVWSGFKNILGRWKVVGLTSCFSCSHANLYSDRYYPLTAVVRSFMVVSKFRSCFLQRTQSMWAGYFVDFEDWKKVEIHVEGLLFSFIPVF